MNLEDKIEKKFKMHKRYNLPNCAHFITTNTYKRLPILRNPEFMVVIIENLKFYRKKYNFKLIGFVILPDHIHLLLILPSAHNISDLIRDFKSFTSSQINRLRGKKGRVWQEGFYDLVIDREDKLIQKLNYIHKNPLRRNLTKDLNEYKYSSFVNYYINDQSLIEIDDIF